MLKKLEKRGKIALARFIALFFGVKQAPPGEIFRANVRNLLIIRQHNQMGDMLLAVPAFRGLRERFPDAHIVLVAAPINTDVMKNNPFIDEVLTYAKEQHRANPFRLVRFVRDIRRRRFDLVIVLNTVSFSITSMLLAAVSGARYRIGSSSATFGHDLSSRYYQLELPLPSEDELLHMHESEHNLHPLRAIGVSERELTSVLVPTGEEEADCENFIKASFPEGSPFVVVHPGAGKRHNIWPPANFAEVIDRLRDIRPMGVVVASGPVDEGAVNEFLASCPSVTAVISNPTVGFLGAVMMRAAVTLCNDTGVMHIAGAVGANCCAVFGPTDPSRWKPVNENVVAVRAADGRIESVTVSDVLAEVARFL